MNNIQHIHYQSAANMLLVLHKATLSFYSYRTKDNTFEHLTTQGPLEELQSTTILLLEWLVEQE